MPTSRGIRVRRGSRIAWLEANQGKHFCQCGCGEPIPLTVEHFNTGVPRYRHGHNARVAHPAQKPPVPAKPCACGCGAMATPGRRFISGHNGRGTKRDAETRARMSVAIRAADLPHRGRTGALSPSWKGGRVKKATGYISLAAREHPFARADGYVFEHRLVVEAHLRETDPASPFLVKLGEQLYLKPECDIHHLNGVTDDNRIENLRPLSRSEHAALSARTRWDNR